MKLKEAIEILKNYKFDMRQSGAVKAVKAITTIDKELEYIMELKERDTAEAAIITGYNRAVGCKVGECPTCGAMIRDYMEFCNDCGQRIKWR